MSGSASFFFFFFFFLGGGRGVSVVINNKRRSVPSLLLRPPRWPSGKACASRAEGPGFESRLRRDFPGVESYQ